MKRTYVDSGVLIAAVQGGSNLSNPALAVLNDPEREFVSSVFVRLETLPQSVYLKRTAEQGFYETFFDAVAAWAGDVPSILTTAYTEACNHGLHAVDALHVASAVHLGADEFVTTEKPTKPLYRVQSVRVVSVRP